MLDHQDEGEAGAREPNGGVSACSGVRGVVGLRCDCGHQTEEKRRFASRFRSRICEVLLRDARREERAESKMPLTFVNHVAE